MAGHPTIGTSYVLAKEYLVDRSDQEACLQIQLEEEIGVIPVTIQMRDHQPELIWMEQPLPTFGSEFEDVDIIAEMLNIDPGAIRETGLPMQVVSCGCTVLIYPDTGSGLYTACVASTRDMGAGLEGLRRHACVRFYQADGAE